MGTRDGGRARPATARGSCSASWPDWRAMVGAEVLISSTARPGLAVLRLSA